MQVQEIINEDGRDFLVIAVPTLPEFFDYGFVSKSGKSFVFRKWNIGRTVLYGYQYIKFSPELTNGRTIIGKNRMSNAYIKTHYFGNFGLPSVRIEISKKTH